MVLLESRKVHACSWCFRSKRLNQKICLWGARRDFRCHCPTCLTMFPPVLFLINRPSMWTIAAWACNQQTLCIVYWSSWGHVHGEPRLGNFFLIPAKGLGTRNSLYCTSSMKSTRLLVHAGEWNHLHTQKTCLHGNERSAERSESRIHNHSAIFAILNLD